MSRVSGKKQSPLTLCGRLPRLPENQPRREQADRYDNRPVCHTLRLILYASKRCSWPGPIMRRTWTDCLAEITPATAPPRSARRWNIEPAFPGDGSTVRTEGVPVTSRGERQPVFDEKAPQPRDGQYGRHDEQGKTELPPPAFKKFPHWFALPGMKTAPVYRPDFPLSSPFPAGRHDGKCDASPGRFQVRVQSEVDCQNRDARPDETSVAMVIPRCATRGFRFYPVHPVNPVVFCLSHSDFYCPRSEGRPLFLRTNGRQ